MSSSLRWAGLIGIATIAALRCTAVFAPQPVFDVDPAANSAPMTVLGPAGSLLLDVLLLLACLVAFLGESLARHRIDWLLILLALLPLPVIFRHARWDAIDLWRGSTWLAAAIACAAVAQLARDRLMRCVLVALLLGMIAPLIARAAAQVSYEHADTLATFEQTRETVFRSRGWDPDSPAARIFERRVRDRQPTAWFATSNIFGSVMAFGTIAWLGLLIASVRARLQSGWAGAMGLCALAAAIGLWWSGSKGALLSTLAGAFVLALYFVPRTLAARSLFSWVLTTLAVFALLAVVVRGTLLPERFAGDISLLFRWHYMQASAGMLADHALTGVGPGGFQDAYTQYRPARNPEEVASAHSMFWDWLCGLGLSGGAWIALVMVLLWRAGRSINGGDAQSMPGRPRVKVMPASIAVVALLGLVPALIIEWPAIREDWMSILVRVLGAAGFAAASLMSFLVIVRGDLRAAFWGLAAGATALVVHGQIEMTFQQPGSAVWMMCVVGLAGSTGHVREENAAAGLGDHRKTVLRRFDRPGGVIVALVLFICAAWLTMYGVVPAMRQQRMMLEAAATIATTASSDDAQGKLAAARLAAADQLERAYDLWPGNVFPLEAAAFQVEMAAAAEPDAARAAPLLARAMKIAQRAIADHRKPSSMALGTMLASRAGDWSMAQSLARELIQLDPNGLGAWKRLGDVCWAAGAREDAAHAYRRALECDRNFELDEFKRLLDKDRQRIEERLVEISK